MLHQCFPDEFLHELALGHLPLVGDGLQVLDQGLREPHRPLLDVLPFARGWRGGRGCRGWGGERGGTRICSKEITRACKSFMKLSIS